MTIGSDADLPSAMRRLAERLVDPLRLEALGKKRQEDLRPWVSPRKYRVEALRAFMQATEYIFRYEPGGADHLLRAVEIDPTFITARVWLVGALAGAGQTAEAAEHLAELHRLEPSASAFERTMIGWADAYVHGDQRRQAAHLEIALSYSPESFILLSNLGFVRREMGDCEGSLAALERPVAAGWAYPPIYTAQAGCLVALGRFTAARRTLEKALEVPPVHAGVYGMLEALLTHAGDLDGARAHAERYAAGAGVTPPEEEYQEVGEVFLRTGSDALASGAGERAIALLRKAALHRPADAAAHELLGDALHRGRRLEEARTAWARAVTLDAERASAHLRLGRLAEETNDAAAAVSHYRSYLALQPVGAEADDVQARIDRLEAPAGIASEDQSKGGR